MTMLRPAHPCWTQRCWHTDGCRKMITTCACMAVRSRRVGPEHRAYAPRYSLLGVDRLLVHPISCTSEGSVGSHKPPVERSLRTAICIEPDGCACLVLVPF